VKILIVDDHPLIVQGLKVALHDIDSSVEAESAGSAEQALAALDDSPSLALILLDLGVPGAEGLDLLARVRDKRPEVPVVVLSANDEREVVLSSLDAGAMGFISKAASPGELREALTGVLVERRIHLPRSVSGGLAAQPEVGGRDLSTLAALGLTERQIEVLGYVVQGLRNKEIARALDRSEVVVKKHVTAALQLLGAPNRTRLLVLLSQKGYRVPSMLAASAG